MKTSTILWSSAFAIAIVATAFAFRGAAEYWIEFCLIITAIELMILRERLARTFASCNVPGRIGFADRKV
jgi:hypothetical protein